MSALSDFKATAIPRLREIAKVQAVFVALDFIDDVEARDVMVEEARAHHFALLPARDQERLLDWIGDVLSDEIAKAEDRHAAIERRMDAAERDDPVRLWEGLAVRCSDPERFRWIFASFSKPYRQHLIGEKNRARES